MFRIACRIACLLAVPLLAACGGGVPELEGTWTSERDASAQVTFDGDKVTMSRPGMPATTYAQHAERTAGGYRLRWTMEDGETLRVGARLDGDRLVLAYDGQEFALRRQAR